MATLPQLIEEDIQQVDRQLRELLEKSDATTALVSDIGGFLIASQGDVQRFDLTTIAALASGAYAATQTIANLVEEQNFDTVYQQGGSYSTLIVRIDEQCLLTVIFKVPISVGAVKYFAIPAAKRISLQLQIARMRDPGAGLDLSVLNIADPSEIFKRQA